MIEADNRGGAHRQAAYGLSFLAFCSLAWLLWGTLILVTGTTLHLIGVVDGWLAYLMASFLWAPYAALSPLAIWVVRRFPANRPRLWSWIGIHLVSSVVFVTLSEVASQGVMEVAEKSFRGRFPTVLPAGAVPDPTNRVSRKPLFEISEVTGLPRPTRRMSVVKAQMNLPIYWMVIAVAEIFRIRVREREKERQAEVLQGHLNEARLAGLRAQLQPHFLFNTLNSISVLIKRDPDGANEMLLNLSELLRMSLRDGAATGIPLREELRLLHLYVGIQRIRFADRFRFHEEVEEGLLDVPVPTLILQPLLENALRHGIERMEGPGSVSLRITSSEGRVVVAMENSCPPGSEGRGSQEASSGIGLRNTAARLLAFYGANHRFEAGHRADGGFRVEFRFAGPVRVSPQRENHRR
jgi:two-component system LytT family sensor kinase